MGNNSVNERSPAESDFLTQLTAGMARELLDMHYEETTPLFYTLGLGNSLSYDVMDPEATDLQYTGAAATLANGYSCNTGRASSNSYQNTDRQVNGKIKLYWEDILADGKVELTYLKNDNWEWKKNQKATVSTVSSYTVGNKTFTFSEPFPSSIEDKYYVDKFFFASTDKQDKVDEELGNAFSSLVEEGCV